MDDGFSDTSTGRLARIIGKTGAVAIEIGRIEGLKEAATLADQRRHEVANGIASAALASFADAIRSRIDELEKGNT